jgi:hypothetical protein
MNLSCSGTGRPTVILDSGGTAPGYTSYVPVGAIRARFSNRAKS